jgi:D-glycero-D-manno-heptose 1,7-bisphosphate phosphatase
MKALPHKAIFLDRDGVLNRERGEHTWLLEDFVLNEGVVEALTEFVHRGYLLIVISNQSGIAKGLYTKAETDYLHLHLQRVLRNKGIELAEIYYCPHHPDTGNCLCRKPGSLLLEKGLARFRLDAAQCYFIGDAPRDAEAGRRAGVAALLIEPNSSLLSVLSLVK